MRGEPLAHRLHTKVDSDWGDTRLALLTGGFCRAPSSSLCSSTSSRMTWTQDWKNFKFAKTTKLGGAVNSLKGREASTN